MAHETDPTPLTSAGVPFHPDDDRRPWPSGPRFGSTDADRTEAHRRMLDRMSCLAEAFPSLRGRPGVRPWDGELFGDQIREGWPGSGAAHAIKFVCGVYNDTHPVAKGFDVHAAAASWDPAHRAAFAAWARRPWWA